MAKVASPMTVYTETVDVVDINLLEKEQANLGKEDSSLDATAPTSCDSSQETTSSSSSSSSNCEVDVDAESVEDSLGPPSAQSPTERPSKRVSFSNVEVREFPRCLGDHPNVSEGPPLTLGWHPCEHYIRDVDAYEQQRDQEIVDALACFYIKRGRTPPERRRRKPVEFNIPCRERIMILHWECGSSNEEAQVAGTSCTGADIKQIIRDTQKSKRQRQVSRALVEFEDFQVKMERCQRKAKKIFMSKRKSIEKSRLEQWGSSSSSFWGESSSRDMGAPLKSILKPDEAEDDGSVAV